MNYTLDAAKLADQAWAKVADAMERGKPAEARSWLRLMQDLQKLAERESEPAAVAEAPEPDTVASAAREYDRLKALVRSGRAKPRDHFALKAAREALRVGPPGSTGGANGSAGQRELHQAG